MNERFFRDYRPFYLFHRLMGVVCLLDLCDVNLRDQVQLKAARRYNEVAEYRLSLRNWNV